jgi:hypothetical protein
MKLIILTLNLGLNSPPAIVEVDSQRLIQCQNPGFRYPMDEDGCVEEEIAYRAYETRLGVSYKDRWVPGRQGGVK